MSDYQLISADAHMDLMQLPPDIFASRVEAEWRQRVPSVEETHEGERWWLLDGKKISRSGFYGPGVTGGDRGDVLAREGFTSGATRPSDPKLRREDCLRDGVDAEVMYGIIGMYRYTEDSALVSRLFHAYNDWLVDFCANDPQRFKGLGCLPSDDVEGAVLELRHVADLGLGGALIAPYHAAMPMWHEMWEPLWETAVETGVPVHFHTFGGASGGGTSSVGYVINGVENAASAGAYTCVAPLQLDEVMTSMLLCGASGAAPRPPSRPGREWPWVDRLSVGTHRSHVRRPPDRPGAANEAQRLFQEADACHVPEGPHGCSTHGRDLPP